MAWWNPTADIPGYVVRYHGGDWEPYIGKWQRQLERMEYLDAHGLAATVRGTSIVLRNEYLKRHIDNIRRRLEIIACLVGRGRPAVISEGPGDRLESLSEKAGDPVAGATKARLFRCVSCHGDPATADHPALPYIAGQKERYLVEQLALFREVHVVRTRPFHGPVRHDEIMDHFAARLRNEDILDLAAYYAGLACRAKQGRPVGAALPEAALCEDCHGSDARNSAPKLRGQKEQYLLKQLRLFRFFADEPDRPTHPQKRYHPAMGANAQPMINETMALLARYYASLDCE